MATAAICTDGVAGGGNDVEVQMRGRFIGFFFCLTSICEIN